MKKYSVSLLFAILMLTFTGSAQVQVVQLNPIFDVGILESSPGSSLSSGPMLCGHSCSGYQSRALMTFSMNLIPAGATIISVNLTVNCSWIDPAGSDTATYTLHALTSGYLEYPFVGGSGAGANWNITGSGFAGPTLWNTPGGDYLPDTLSSQWVPHALGLHNFATTSNFVNCVQGWLDFPTTNAGIIMIADTVPCGTDKYFDGWEMPVPTVLEINYILPCSTGPAAVCQDIDIYLDGSGNGSIVASDLDAGSVDSCMTGGLTFSASQTSFSCADLSTGGGLVISGVYDGPLTGGTPKGVELYAGSAIADLSAYGVGSANNGGGTDGIEFTFPPVSVAAGTFLYVTTDSIGFNNFFGFDADFISGSMAINGDDAVELFQDSLVVDVFGDINVDGTGTAWDYLDGWAYRNDLSVANNGVWVETEFYYSGVDAMDLELTNATAVTPFPIGSYTAAGSGIPVTLTVTDGLGNTDVCTTIVTVLDTLAPIPNVPVLADITSDCPVDSILVVASDNCQGQITGTTTTTFPVSASTTITWTYTDASGNTSTQDQIVTINGLDVTTTTSPSYVISATATGVTYQWIDCFNNVVISGATGQDFVVTVSGDYAVIITNGACTDTSACVPVQIWGIDELIDLGMTVSPNPTTGIFNVTFENTVAGIVTIVDANGRLIQTQELNNNSISIDLTSNQSGIYFMEIATENGVSRERVVKY